MSNIDLSTLREGEAHPAALDAQQYLASIHEKLPNYLEAFSSCALTGENRNAEICGDTLRHLMAGDPVSDRYILGLAFTIKLMEELQDN